MTADHDRRSADELAEDLERRAARTRRAADSERHTEEHLDRELASRGYVCLHDCRWPGSRTANIDHVVIGPSGVWVVDDKVMTHDVYVGRDGRLRSGRYSMTKPVLKLHAQVQAVRGAIGATDGHGVLSIHQARLQSATFEVDGVHVAKALWSTTRTIHTASKRLDADEVAALADRAVRVLDPRAVTQSKARTDRDISVADVLDPDLPPAPREPSARQRQVRRRPPSTPRPWRAPSAPSRRRRSPLSVVGAELTRVVIGIVLAIVVTVVAFGALSAASKRALDLVTGPTATYTCMQPGAPGRVLHVHWSDASVIAVVWQSGASAPVPLPILAGSTAERSYLVPGQVSSIELVRGNDRPSLRLTSTAPSTPC